MTNNGCCMRRPTAAARSLNFLAALLLLCGAKASYGAGTEQADRAGAPVSGQAGEATAPRSNPPARFTVRTERLSVDLSAAGEVVACRLGERQLLRPLRGGSALVQCTNTAFATARELPGGGVEFSRQLVHATETAHRARLVERFLPGRDSIRWELEVQGDGAPWTTGIETRLEWGNPAAVWWTAWDDPEQQRDGWRDPLVFRPLTDTRLWLGETRWDETGPPIRGYQPGAGRFVIPLVTVAEPDTDSALGVVLSPEDPLLELSLTVEAAGAFAFRRLDHRLSRTNSVRFAMDLVAHAADWRAALGWMTRRYAPFFEPPNPHAHQFAGLGAYSDWEGDLDAARLKRMGFRVNWKASYDFPYMGMFLPPIADDTPYPRLIKGNRTSIAQMRDYSRRMKALGFSVLNYFNVTEFGATTGMPPEADPGLAPSERWRNVHNFMRDEVADGILLDLQGRRLPSWEGCVVMDCGGPRYRAFLLEQAQRHIEKLPDSDGICIDRLDWLRWVNFRADDGVSWRRAQPVRSLYSSWRGLLPDLGALFHASNKVIFVNAMINRTDLLRHVDGIYHEFGHNGRELNGTALQCVFKPAIAWTPDENALKPDPDAYFQRHLYLGVFPTAPLPANDHTIAASAWTDRWYLDYGPLFDALRGRRWVLQPRAVEVLRGTAKANLFQTGEACLVPVMLGGIEKSATVRLRSLPVAGPRRGEVLYPGKEGSVALPLREDGAACLMEVPLERGCALVRIPR
jgi:hypothetical protein